MIRYAHLCCVPLLVVAVGANAADASACATAFATEATKVSTLSYEEFDQRPGTGFRKLAEQGCVLQTAELIVLYLKARSDLSESQRHNLHFHAGQAFAFAGQYEPAIREMRSAKASLDLREGGFRWSSYVDSSIAFLEHDKDALVRFRDELAAGKDEHPGNGINLEVVDRFIQHFDRSYAEAYSAVMETDQDRSSKN